MARPSKYNWNDIKKHYEAGMSQSEIVLQFECPKSSLSERINKEGWTQSELVKSYIKGSVEINEQKANIIEQDVRLAEIANNIIDEQTRRRGLVFNASEKALKKLDSLIDMTEDAQDMKHIVDSIDKASITLGVNQRHANSQVTVNNTNAVQNNNTPLTLEDAKKQAELLGVPLSALI